MKVKLNSSFLDPKGESLTGFEKVLVAIEIEGGLQIKQDPKTGEPVFANLEIKKDVLLKDVLIKNLLNEKKELKPLDKIESYNLFLKIRDCKKQDIDLSRDEVDRLLDACKGESILIYGQIAKLLSNGK